MKRHKFRLIYSFKAYHFQPYRPQLSIAPPSYISASSRLASFFRFLLVTRYNH
ncbi:predicted protein [Plenodomus lingam JN3]|uniref:Predicted protein n=1 Tax=Leptosphaeria maculans (strain JN3 / isolate v23.1.3 / race Av1-4-5-6-7-8) TaxID=985895 RepID=E5A284_LEPMJ|nr:predicted protein [Plenodomus lingam JN3]CBX97961.1 predicted protein [Plenodomus lingam JN3]